MTRALPLLVAAISTAVLASACLSARPAVSIPVVAPVAVEKFSTEVNLELSPQQVACGASRALAAEGFRAAVIGKRIRANRRIAIEDGRLALFDLSFAAQPTDGAVAVLRLDITLKTFDSSTEVTVGVESSGFRLGDGQGEQIAAALASAFRRQARDPACRPKTQD